MANAKSSVARPLSPHLQIYSRLINMVVSILHRLTGAALYFGTALLGWWLIALAQGEKYYNFVSSVMGHPIGLLILFGYTWALIHHMLGGLRHLYWDTGRGFSLDAINRLAWLNVIGSIVITIAIWAVALYTRGAF